MQIPQPRCVELRRSNHAGKSEEPPGPESAQDWGWHRPHRCAGAVEQTDCRRWPSEFTRFQRMGTKSHRRRCWRWPAGSTRINWSNGLPHGPFGVPGHQPAGVMGVRQSNRAPRRGHQRRSAWVLDVPVRFSSAVLRYRGTGTAALRGIHISSHRALRNHALWDRNARQSGRSCSDGAQE
ncbi:MAG: hypothetical protein QOD02_5072, partial [Mycobacterium sp.]|nr:hypothetical protein [Mycobacterium sp.]